MKIFALLLTLSLATSAYAIPKAPFDALKVKSAVQFNDNQAAYDFEGIVKLSNCSGSLIRFSGQPTTSKALVLTNGHCYSSGPFGGMIKPGEVIVNSPVKRSMKIFDKQMKLFPITTSRVVYAAMTDTDITIYELTQSYDEIQNKFNIQSFDLDTIKPSLGTNIEIVSGYWDRGYSCAIDAFIFNLKEGAWLFKDSIRYTATCDTIGGTSGSPIIAKGTRHVIAINNTANEGGARCTENNPCEVSENGTITSARNAKYGQQTHNIYSCLSPDFSIDLDRAGCALAKPAKN
ncbi:MAG: trypsin-like peptidase domain-containing protein [Bacteriovorax sp.]|nr:trypsin-like peptidase domain-containing protein [Bacteriovorax sp.]